MPCHAGRAIGWLRGCLASLPPVPPPLWEGEVTAEWVSASPPPPSPTIYFLFLLTFPLSLCPYSFAFSYSFYPIAHSLVFSLDSLLLTVLRLSFGYSLTSLSLLFFSFHSIPCHQQTSIESHPSPPPRQSSPGGGLRDFWALTFPSGFPIWLTPPTPKENPSFMSSPQGLPRFPPSCSHPPPLQEGEVTAEWVRPKALVTMVCEWFDLLLVIAARGRG